MSARQWRIGAGIAITFPFLLYLTLRIVSNWLNRSRTDDFQYHDSYLSVWHVSWAGYSILGLGAFFIYALIVYRKARAKKTR